MVRDQEISRSVPFVPVGWGRRLQRIEGKSLILVLVVSIPTAPTIHLPDRWTLNKNMRGQKGADRANDPVSVFLLSGTGDNRIRLPFIMHTRDGYPLKFPGISLSLHCGSFPGNCAQSCVSVQGFTPSADCTLLMRQFSRSTIVILKTRRDAIGQREKTREDDPRA
jgi:hypothetical protein